MTKRDLFYRMCDILKEHQIKYAIVGNTDGYPDTIGSDVDIVISRSQIDEFHRVIWEIQDANTKVVQMFQHEIVAFYYIVFHFGEHGIQFIQPDTCTDYYRHGKLFLRSDDLLEGVREAPQGGFMILAPEKEFVYYLLKKIEKRKISEVQFSHMEKIYCLEKEACMRECVRFWNKESQIVIQEALEKKDIDILRNHLDELQKAIHFSTGRSLGDTMRNVLLKVKRILHPTGLVVGVLGPDGSGKTTMLEQVKDDIFPAFRRINQYHLFPMGKQGVEANEVVTDPHSLKTRGFFLSFLKLLYFVWLYNWGYIRIVLPQKMRSTLVFFDRYYQDVLIDPDRYRNGTPVWVAKMIGRLIPSPDLWIVLDAPTEIIQQRKQEVSREETACQRKKYLAFAQNTKNCLLVDTNRDVKVISTDVCTFICNHLHERAEKRYKK